MFQIEKSISINKFKVEKNQNSELLQIILSKEASVTEIDCELNIDIKDKFKKIENIKNNCEVNEIIGKYETFVII